MTTVEPVLKDHPIGHKNCGLSRQVVSGDRFSYIEMQVLLPKKCRLSRLGLSWQWSLMTDFTVYPVRYIRVPGAKSVCYWRSHTTQQCGHRRRLSSVSPRQ